MSKESAMSMITGEAAPAVNPSLVAGGPPPAEATETPEVKPDQGIDSDRFARLAQKEAKLQKDRELYKSEQQKLYEEKAKLKEVQDKINAFEAMRKSDPVAALKEIGFSENDIFNFMASKEVEEPTPEQKAAQAAQAEIEKWKKEQADKEARELAERDERAIKTYREEIGKSIAKDADTYEYLAYHGKIGQDLVFDTILEILKEEPTLTPVDVMKEAMQMVEEYYEKEDEAMNAIKKRAAKRPVANEPEAPLKPEMPGRSRTVHAPTAPVRPTPKMPAAPMTSSRGETPAQKRERLENWLRNGVKS